MYGSTQLLCNYDYDYDRLGGQALWQVPCYAAMKDLGQGLLAQCPALRLGQARGPNAVATVPCAVARTCYGPELLP